MHQTNHVPSDMRARARAAFDDRGKQIAALLDAYIVPDDKINAVVEYSIKLLAGNAHMKNDRIVRKAVEKFNLEKRPVEKPQAKVVSMDRGLSTTK